MSEEIVKASQQIQHYTLGAEEIQTLVSSGVIPPNTPEPTIRLFSKYCTESNLSPFKRQVHLVKRWSQSKGDQFTIQTGIDGYRAIANRTGVYAGNDDYLFDEGVSQYHCIKEKRKNPQIAISTVYKLVGGIRVPFSASAEWSAYCPSNEKQRFMWDKMPYLMLGKCAESIALRKAFPEELSGVYTDEEMLQATPESVEMKSHEVSVQTKQGKEVSFKEFNPKVERITFGKFSGMEWVALDKGYLEWIVKNGQPDSKMRAEATLKYLEAGQSQQEPIDDLAEVFGDAQEVPMEVPLIDILLSGLDEVALLKDADALGKWQSENKPKIEELPENQKTLLRNAYKKALKESKGTK